MRYDLGDQYDIDYPPLVHFFSDVFFTCLA